MLKFSVFLASLSLAGSLAAAVFTPGWDSVKQDAAPDGSAVYLRTPRLAGVISTERPRNAANELKIEVADGALCIDTREFKKANPEGAVVLRLNTLPFEKSQQLKEVFLELTLSGSPDGLKGNLFFEGSQGEAKKHYWKIQPFSLGDGIQTIRFEQTLPGDLNELHLRCDLASAGVYRIAEAAYGEPSAAVVDTGSNHITNGGAEFGWYNTGTFGKNSLAMADDGRIYDGRKKIVDDVMGAELDREVKHSGLASFRLTGGADKEGRLTFNSVPFLPGKPATFSVWLKAEKPRTEVQLGLFLCSGIIYSKSVMAGTVWKRYELAIPRWGEDFPGIFRLNDVTNGAGSIYKQVTPIITPVGGAVWADDATYALGPAAEATPPAVAITGKFTPERGYATAGTPIKAELTFEVLRTQPEFELRWEIVDFFGKKVAESPEEKLSLKPGNPVTREFTVRLPEELRGPFTWRFTAGGEIYNFYFGMIGPESSQLARLGVNYDPRQNVERFIELTKEFRFGSVRVWSNYRDLPYHAFRDIPYFRKAGFHIMVCMGLTGAAPAFQVPKDFNTWQRELTREASRVRGMVDSYEILNESNIWSGRTPVTEPEKFEEMTPQSNARVIRAAAEALKAGDPAVKIAGPASCHTDVNWTANVLKEGADQFLDIITEHPYRELPELPDYEDDLKNLQSVLARYKANFPVIASEAGERGIDIFKHDEIPDFERKRAAYNTRMMLIGLANGVEQYHHFSIDLSVAGGGTSWNMVLMGNPENNTLHKPAPVMFALRNLADRLGDAPPAGRVKLGSNFRCYLFDRGDRRVAAVWKWNGGDAAFQLPPAALAGLSAFDFMGNPAVPEKLVLNEYPLYLETPLKTDEFARLLADAGLGDGGEAIRTQLAVTGERTFGITVRNVTNRPVSGTIRILTAGVTEKTAARFDDIPGEESRTILFNTSEPITPKERPIKAEIALSGRKGEVCDFNLRSILVPRITAAPVVDGDLSDWPANAKFARIDSRDAVKNAIWTPAEERIAADLYLSWDDDFLYFAAVVDKAECVENGIGPSRLWGGDGLQIGFDPLRNATPDLAGYQDDDYEFSVGRFNGEPLAFMHYAAAAAYDSVDKALGIVPSVRSAIKTADGKTTYELAFPRLLVSPFRLQPNSAMRFNAIVNVNNGKGRAGYLEFTPGLGQTPKRPGLFTDLVLLK